MVMLIKNGSSRRRRAPMAEINVTPFVDVMLVLLVVFMITAPMLTTGVAVDLPKTKAQPLPSSEDRPIVVTVDKAGIVFVGTQEEPVELEALAAMLSSVANNDLKKRIFVRGDENVAYGKVITVLALIQRAGFSNAGMVVDPKPAPAAIRKGG
jgi:biopolymer transport protein TolR